MVSTRGIKGKFNIGERVLCMEPDKTKLSVRKTIEKRPMSCINQNKQKQC